MNFSRISSLVKSHPRSIEPHEKDNLPEVLACFASSDTLAQEEIITIIKTEFGCETYDTAHNLLARAVRTLYLYEGEQAYKEALKPIFENDKRSWTTVWGDETTRLPTMRFSVEGVGGNRRFGVLSRASFSRPEYDTSRTIYNIYDLQTHRQLLGLSEEAAQVINDTTEHYSANPVTNFFFPELWEMIRIDLGFSLPLLYIEAA